MTQETKKPKPDRLWNLTLSVVDFEAEKRPRFVLSYQSFWPAKLTISTYATMQLWSPKVGIVREQETSFGFVNFSKYGVQTLELLADEILTTKEKYNLDNRNNLFFYIRSHTVGWTKGDWRNLWMNCRHDQRECFIFQAWEEPRPAGIPLFIPCGGYVDPQREWRVD